MGIYSELVHKLPEEKEIMEQLTIITDDFAETVKISQPQKYNMFIEKVKHLHSNNHFSKETLDDAYKHKHIEQIYPVDVTTNFVTKEFDVDFSKEHFNEYDLNFIMNDMHKNFGSMYNNDTAKLAELTLTWLDTNHGNAYKYYHKLYAE